MKELIKWLEMFRFSRTTLLHGNRMVEPVTNKVKVPAYKYLICAVCIRRAEKAIFHVKLI